MHTAWRLTPTTPGSMSRRRRFARGFLQISCHADGSNRRDVCPNGEARDSGVGDAMDQSGALDHDVTGPIWFMTTIYPATG
jgi:hypothetical protein